MFEPLLQIIAQHQIWLLAFVILLVGISKAGFAGGLGVLATPLLLLQFPPKEALALLLPLLMITRFCSPLSVIGNSGIGIC